jgi:hypothetical protein
VVERGLDKLPVALDTQLFTFALEGTALVKYFEY